MATVGPRGSDKVLEQIFGGTTITPEQLSSAVQQATSSGLKIERWWWKGQPHPDWFQAHGTLRPDQAATTLTQLIGFHNDVNQVSFEVFPKGTPRVDAIDINITVNRNLGG
jgi:hypothetical protein